MSLFFALGILVWSFFLLLINAANASEREPGGIFEALSGTNLNDYALLKDIGLNAGGWASVGFTYNPAKPADR